MNKGGRRHHLVMYTYTINHLWQPIFSIGVVLLLLVAALTWLPRAVPAYTPIHMEGWILWLVTGAGGFAIFVALFLITIRKSAYVQPFPDHLRLVTPFLRMNISYRRINQSSSTEMVRLFPLEDLKGQKREFIRPISGLTAIVLDMKGWPLSRPTLSLFLSPFFFPDRTARLALLVPDWIKFSTELDSFRHAWQYASSHPNGMPQSDLLASLSQKQ
jgi:hypothetical protein